MTRMVVLALLVIGSSTMLLAIPAAPEISPDSAGSAVALLAGAVLVIRSRRK